MAALAAVAALLATCGAQAPTSRGPSWASPGLVGGGGWPYAGVPLDPDDADGAVYFPNSSVVRLADGTARLVPFGGAETVTLPADDPRVERAIRSDAAWLATGNVPGRRVAAPPVALAAAPGPGPSGTPSPATGSTPATGEGHRDYGDMASRALLDLRLLTRPNGASLASWYGAWQYAWPRDSAFHAAAFTITGHEEEARSILRFLARAQSGDGLWAARYKPDGSPVVDGREAQLDSLGWTLWASWLFQKERPDAADRTPELWPMVRRAGDRLTASLGSDGLPPPSSDYWERPARTEADPDRATLGVVGPVLSGLRSAAAFAAATGRADRADRWSSAAHRLDTALVREFGPHGYPRSPLPGGLMDTSVTFVAPPFRRDDPAVAAATANAVRRQTLPGGGVLPGERWPGNKEVAWTPEVGLFALADAASGRREDAVRWLDWLSEHRTSLGALPEKVGPDGEPAAVAPLGWTASLVLLTLHALERPLPIPGESG